MNSDLFMSIFPKLLSKIPFYEVDSNSEDDYIKSTKLNHTMLRDFETSRKFIFKDAFSVLPTEELGELVDSNDAPISLPFECCYFENLGQSCFPFVVSKDYMNLIAVLIKEISPSNYEYITIFANPDTMKIVALHYPNNFPQLNTVIQQMVSHMSGKLVGIDNRKVNFKCRINTRKVTGSYRNVVYLKHKNDKEGSIGLSRSIVWSHMWEVRGHWRKCSGLGKNRYGKYTTPYFTWVKSHTKGMGELVIKDRVF